MMAMCLSDAGAAARKLEIVLIGEQFRADGRLYEQRAEVIRLIERVKPSAIVLKVCISVRESTLVELQKAIEPVHQGGLSIDRLPKQAVECSQSQKAERMIAT